jgi:fumiquinazoline F synthetase
MIPFQQVSLQRIAKICRGSQQAYNFQTLLIFQPQENSSGQGIIGEGEINSDQLWISSYSLTLLIRPGMDSITARASFDSRIVQPWSVQKLLEQLEFVMLQLDCAGPEQLLTGIETVTPCDLEEIWQWNSAVLVPVERCVHEMIKERAQA